MAVNRSYGHDSEIYHEFFPEAETIGIRFRQNSQGSRWVVNPGSDRETTRQVARCGKRKF
jgi:hypothetical protein